MGVGCPAVCWLGRYVVLVCIPVVLGSWSVGRWWLVVFSGMSFVGGGRLRVGWWYSSVWRWVVLLCLACGSGVVNVVWCCWCAYRSQISYPCGFFPWLLWFDLEADLVLENPKIRQPCAGSFSKAPNRSQSTIQGQKPCSKISKCHTLFLTATGISMFHMYICRVRCAIARELACCAAAARTHTTTPP